MHFVAPGDSNTVKHIVSESVSATLLHLGATWLYSVLEVTTLHLGATWLHSVLGFPLLHLGIIWLHSVHQV